MNIKHTFFALALATSALTLTCCSGSSKETPAADNAQEQTQSTLKADEAINRAINFYAGISKEGVDISETDAKAWDAYSTAVKGFVERSAPTLKMVDGIASTDFADFRDSIDFVFYPFSGADFMYPYTLFPNAKTYFLCGIEKTGSPIDRDIVTSFSQYETYRQALATYFRTSYFASKEMAADWGTMEVDGICPVITMLMAISKCEIISIKYKDIDRDGAIVNTADKRKLLEIRFFRAGSQQEQTLYYFASNVADKSFDEHLKAYLDTTLPEHRVGCYMKAASFLLHNDFFSTMRSYILDYSHAIVQDDSGIPYRFLTDKFSVNLYGEYVKPSEEFSEECYQPDLQKRYVEDASSIKPLPCRIGYNSPSNWIVARRK